jgi:hypothetical protein
MGRIEGSDGFDRTIGLRRRSNDQGAIFALTFAAIDTIVRRFVESNFFVCSLCLSFTARGKARHDRQREVSMKGENCVNKLMQGFSYRIVTIACGGLLLSGCVMAEKYDAEKARSLNFQRLLAQEEKRTGELDSEVKRAKNELMEYEARNRELTAQVQAAREQMARVQDEAEAMKESALLERKAKTDMKRKLTPMRKPLPVESMSDTDDLSASAPGMAADVSAMPESTDSLLRGVGSSAIHVVKPGETLYRISRQHGVTVDKVRKWNKLPDDIIEVGQKLIVGQE